MSDENEVLVLWNELKGIVADLELDVQKNANGTASAGVRARKGLRHLKSVASALVKTSTNRDKTLKVAKAAAKVAG